MSGFDVDDFKEKFQVINKEATLQFKEVEIVIKPKVLQLTQQRIKRI
jgi:hypothetical protein